MYLHRSLEKIDLEPISLFPQSEEELFYISPRSVFPLTPDQIMNLAKDRFEPTVVINKATGEVVAYANFYSDESDKNSFWLGNVIVSPEYRGTGASQYLLNIMLEKAKNNLKIKKLKLACHNTNSRGLAFYSKYDFKPFDIKIIGIGTKKFITIHMSKILI